jgi:DNA-binding XRE family transcriptional regulator
MITKETGRGTVRSADQGMLGYEAVTMALAIIADRIRGLPTEDRVELYALMKELLGAATCEDSNAAMVAIREVLDQSTVRLSRMDQGEKSLPGDGLQKWIDYASKKIRELRDRAGMTQDELAAKSGLPQSHISRLESGKHSPSRVTLEKIAAALGLSVSEFDPSA